MSHISAVQFDSSILELCPRPDGKPLSNKAQAHTQVGQKTLRGWYELR